mmetsp:Transcript_7959/g.23904  ORF Transcript_7959/g.23904 Transcript_7959/m.23904 type:complete len:215 (+) Transcript_7959:1212-1856(+)
MPISRISRRIFQPTLKASERKVRSAAFFALLLFTPGSTPSHLGTLSDRIAMQMAATTLETPSAYSTAFPSMESLLTMIGIATARMMTTASASAAPADTHTILRDLRLPSSSRSECWMTVRYCPIMMHASRISRAKMVAMPTSHQLASVVTSSADMVCGMRKRERARQRERGGEGEREREREVDRLARDGAAQLSPAPIHLSAVPTPSTLQAPHL